MDDGREVPPGGTGGSEPSSQDPEDVWLAEAMSKIQRASNNSRVLKEADYIVLQEWWRLNRDE